MISSNTKFLNINIKSSDHQYLVPFHKQTLIVSRIAYYIID